MNIQDIFNWLGKIKIFILDILFPIECIGCGKADIWLCDECLGSIPVNQMDICVVCKKFSEGGQTHTGCQDKTFLDGVIVACPWESKLLQDAIHNYKYKFIENLSYPLSELLIKKLDYCINFIFNFGAGVTKDNSRLVPVPLYPRRLRWRGFNQAELIANKIADHLCLEVGNDILTRKKYTTPQMSLKRKRRLDNLQNAFAVTRYGEGFIAQGIKNFVLVDDVLTTGATMNQCARVLKGNGAKNVWGIVLTRG